MTSYLVEGLNFGAASGVGKFCNCAWFSLFRVLNLISHANYLYLHGRTQLLIRITVPFRKTSRHIRINYHPRINLILID